MFPLRIDMHYDLQERTLYRFLSQSHTTAPRTAIEMIEQIIRPFPIRFHPFVGSFNPIMVIRRNTACPRPGTGTTQRQYQSEEEYCF